MTPLEDPAFIAEAWTPAVERYGAVTHLTVLLYDSDERMVSSPTPATPLFSVFEKCGYDPELFVDCARQCLAQNLARPPIIQVHPYGLAVVGTSLLLEGQIVGAAVAGYAFVDFSQSSAIERLAKQARIPFRDLWQLVRQQQPMARHRLMMQGELLQVLGDTILRENYRTRKGIADARAYEEERRRSEALAELDAAKTAFFSSVSHEFRTPLTLILGSMERMASPVVNDRLTISKADFDAVNRNCRRLLNLVNTLLDFSRVEAGRTVAQYTPTDLAALTADLSSNFRSVIENAGLRLLVDCPPLSHVVHVDRNMWEKVVLNLLSNAFKFTIEGEINVSLRDSDNGFAELAISDTGTGISKQDLPRIFDRFHRVENARGRTYEGTGIGLALVQELVKQHGGVITVESVLQRGTTFRVRIPFGRKHLPTHQLGPPMPLAATTATAAPYVEETLRWLSNDLPNNDNEELTKRGSVLLLEDNAEMRAYLVSLLSPDYVVTTAANGREGLKLALFHRPDVVLSDVMMPVLDGLDFLKALRTHPQTNTVPVILLSARAGEDARLKGLEAHADDYLVKPFGARELLARVDVHVSLSRQRKEMRARLITAQEEERRRIASELHDTIGQELVLLQFDLNALQSALGEGIKRRAEAQFRAIQERMQHIIGDVRQLSHQLHPTVVVDLGLEEAVIQLAKQIENYHSIQVSVAARNVPTGLSMDVSLGLYRIAQESLWNAVKHSSAQRIKVALSGNAKSLTLRVQDTGKGFEPDKVKRGLGLINMMQRAESLGGSLELKSQPGSGTTIEVRIPHSKDWRERDFDRRGTKVIG